MKRINVSVIDVEDDAPHCDDDCKILDIVLRACQNAEAMKNMDSEHIDHVLAEHWKYRRDCSFGNCRWRQISMITVDRVHKKGIDLHGHFYHGVTVDREENDEKDDEEQWIEYESISLDLAQSTLQYGDRSTVNNLKNAKFRDLKSEMTQNECYQIGIEEWKRLLRIGRVLAASTKAMIMGLTMMEIVALKLFVDFSKLQQFIRRCFHERDQKKRLDFQRTFYNLNSRIKSAIKKSQDEIGGKLYIPIFSDDRAVNQSTIFKFTCFGPTNLYADYQTVGSLVSNVDNVIILELYPPFDRCGMDISWLCSYSNGARILFIDGAFQIADVLSERMAPPDLNLYGLEDHDRMSIADLIEMEDDLLIAVQNLTVNEREHILSLNKDDRRGLFAKLSEKQIVCILTLLNLQYRSGIWKEIDEILSDESECQRMQIRLRAILYLRDHVLESLKNVQEVVMEDMIQSIRMFFTESEVVRVPFLSMIMILKLFPMAELVKIGRGDFDWTLDKFVDFAKAHDVEEKHVALRHIQFAVSEEEARNLLNDHDPRENLKMLRKRGWKLVTPNDLCYFGSMPEPEPPFLPMFMDSANGHSKGMENAGRTVSGLSLLMKKERIDEAKRDIDETELPMDDMLDIEHNVFSCTLSDDVFHSLDYQFRLVDSLRRRKDGVEMPFSDEFAERCNLVESLVLDPLPMELHSIFCNEDGKLSFNVTMQIFPNLTDLYLRSTTFDFAECLRFIDFIDKQSNSMNLQNIHFSVTDRLKLGELSKVQWSLRDIGWRIVSSKNILKKYTPSKWQCKECGHFNRSMMIGGEYQNPQPADTECALCHRHDDDEKKEDDVISHEKNGSVSQLVSDGIPAEISSEFTAIGNSKCRKLEYFDSEQMVYVLYHFVFLKMEQRHRQKLDEYEQQILEYFGTLSVNEIKAKTEWKRIAKELSVKCCGTVKLAGTIRKALLNEMDSIDVNQHRIPGAEWLPRCAALERIQFILRHAARWAMDGANHDTQSAARISAFMTALEEQCSYSLHDLQRDIQHIVEHRNFLQMAIEEPCDGLEQCIHCRRNKKFGDGAEGILESVEWFGSNDIGEVTRIMIFDRLHCVMKHYLMPKTLRDREWTFNLLLMDIRNAIFPQYAHGIRIKYSSETPKHRNLITELTQNEVCRLSKEAVDGFIKKANGIMMNNKVVKGLKAKRSSPRDGIEKGDGMFIEFILCVLIYCSVTVYCTKFRASFRKLFYNDTEHTIRARHCANFYWFGRYLECALKFYGKKAKKKQTFFHGLDCKFIFDDFSAVFEIPLSTTNDQIAAENFAQGQGIIVCVSPKFKRTLTAAYYLPISGTGLSPFQNEREFLVCSMIVSLALLALVLSLTLYSLAVLQFAGDTVLAITNLLIPGSENQSNKQYVNCFLYWERILEQTESTRNSYIYGVINKKSARQWKERQLRCLVPLIRRKMKIGMNEQNELLKENEIPKYIEQLFNHFCDRKSTVNLSCIGMEIEFMDLSLKDILFTISENGQDVVDIDTLSLILPNLVSYIDDNGITLPLSRR